MDLDLWDCLGLFRNGKTRILAKFQWTDLVICSHSREGKPLSYSWINMVLRIVLAATSHLYCFDRMVCAEEQTLLVNGQFHSNMKIKRPFFRLLQKLAIQNWTVFFYSYVCLLGTYFYTISALKLWTSWVIRELLKPNRIFLVLKTSGVLQLPQFIFYRAKIWVRQLCYE